MSDIQVHNPVRIFDSRDPNNQHNAGTGTFVLVSLRPHGYTAADADGVILTATGIGQQHGYFTFWNGDGNYPLASNLNLAPGQIENNMVFVPLFNGAFGVYSNGANHLIVDQVGWYKSA